MFKHMNDLFSIKLKKKLTNITAIKALLERRYAYLKANNSNKNWIVETKMV